MKLMRESRTAILFSFGFFWVTPLLSLGATGAPDVSRRSRAVEFEVPLKSSSEVRVHRPMAQGPALSGVEGSVLDAFAIHRFEPQELNPHRRRFALERNLSLVGLKAQRVSSSEKAPLFRVVLEGVESQTITHLREAGPWYESLSAIACLFRGAAVPAGIDLLSEWEKAPNSPSLLPGLIEPLHATEEGSRESAEFTQARWNERLKASLPLLSRQLDRLRENTEVRALLKAELILASWRDLLEMEYTSQILPKARAHQFEYEKTRVIAQGLCASGQDPTLAALTSPFALESRSARTDSPFSGVRSPRLLARVPAKQTSGVFTVRAGLQFQGRTIVGRFLVDPTTPVSLVDPGWLGAQGVSPKLLRTHSGVPVRVHWSFGTGMAEPLAANFGVEFGGSLLPGSLNFHALKLRDQLGSPDYATSCCDGVLGLDFLRSHWVEFQRGPQPALQVWEASGERTFPGLQESEVWVTQSGKILSDCDWKDSQGKSVARGVTWDIGKSALQSKDRTQAKTDSWSLDCRLDSNSKMRKTVPSKVASAGFKRSDVPSVGILRMSQGNFVLDLKRGRIWIQTEKLNSPLPRDRAGIELGFFEVDEVTKPFFASSRAVRVLSFSKGSAAEKQLSSAGFVPGVELIEINGRSLEGLDRWEVEQAFSGEWGGSVKIKWRKKGKLPPRKGKPSPDDFSEGTLQLT